MLNAAVYGVAPKSIDKRYGKNLDEEEGLLAGYGLSPQDTAALSMSLKCGVKIKPEEMWHRIHTIYDGESILQPSRKQVEIC